MATTVTVYVLLIVVHLGADIFRTFSFPEPDLQTCMEEAFKATASLATPGVMGVSIDCYAVEVEKREHA